MTGPVPYDVLIAADLRTGRARGTRIAQEVRAQVAAGFSTGLLHVPDPGVWRGPPFSEPIARCIREGLVDQLDTREPVRARLLVIHSPGSFLGSEPLPVEAERVVVVLDAQTLSPWGELAATKLTEVVSQVGSWAGSRPSVGVTRSVVREAVRAVPGLDLLPADWTDVIDVSRWARRADRPAASPFVLGRHDLEGLEDLPGTARDREAAYPRDPAVHVALLAASQEGARLLGRLSSHDVFPPGSIDRRRFLAMLDLFVCFPRSEGSLRSLRPLLEAIASGVPVIGPPWLASSFGDGIVTGDPSDVLPLAREIAQDPARARSLADRGLETIATSFSPATHIARIRELIGDPSGLPLPPEPISPPRARSRVLFMSSNGAGVGHLMRLMSIARHAGDDIEPIFFTLSQAVPAVRRMGFPVEYMASAGYTGLATPHWNTLLRRRLAEVIELVQPRALVFDGTAPYRGLIQARHDHPGLPFVWSRRAMWRPGMGHRALERSDDFDLVIEPGEFAAERDTGGTVPLRSSVRMVDPIMVIEPDDLLEPADAKRELGLDPDQPAALVQLGAGNINDISAVTTIALSRLAGTEGLQVCTASSIIGTKGSPILERVRTVSVYPLARYFRAFDFAISASGYNTFHELIAAGIPTIFIPNLDTALDDQRARARYAEDVGVGLCIEEFDESAFDAALETMLDPERRREMAERCTKLAPGNGARDAMGAIRDLIDSWPAMAVRAPTQRRLRARLSPKRVAKGLLARSGKASGRIASGFRLIGGRTIRASRRSLRRIREGRDLERKRRPARGRLQRRLTTAVSMVRRPGRMQKRTGLPIPAGRPYIGGNADRLPVAFILLWGVDDGTLEQLVDRVAVLQRSRLRIRPLFVTDRDAFGAFRRYGYQFEYVMPRDEWNGLGLPLSWTEYRWRRLSSLIQAYAPDHVVSASGPDAADQAETALLAAVLRPVAD